MSTGFEVEVPDDFESESNFLSQPGTYHCVIEDVKIGVGPKGNAYEGATVTLSVLDGTVPTEKKKTKAHMVGFPKATDRDGGKFRTKVLAKFLLAANQVDPSQKGKKISVDENLLVGQQVVASFEMSEKNDQGKQYLEIGNGGMNVYHVDDPHTEGIPKDKGALSLIPKELRHPKEWFDKVYAKKAPVASSASPAGQQSAASTAPVPKVDISQL